MVEISDSTIPDNESTDIPPEEQLKSQNILIVDDSKVIIDTLKGFLKAEGFNNIYSAENGKEGLSVLDEVNPILVILDLQMPVMDGIEFLDHIKIKPTDPYSVTILTGYSDDTTMKKCFDRGVNSFLKKPCNRVEFCCVVKRAIELKLAEKQIIIETKKRVGLERDLKDKEMEEKLCQADKMITVGTMAAGVAHDVNNPLSVAIGDINLLKRDVGDLLEFINRFSAMSLPPDLSNEVEKLKKEMDIPYVTENLNKKMSRCEEAMGRIKEIVNSLKDFSRLDEGDEIVEIDIIKEIETSIQMIPKRYQRGIEIKKEFSSLPKIPCFGRQIGQVFLNLIVNAFQAMKNGGLLRIETSLNNQYVYVKISDNGPGIPESTLEKIFEPFYTTKPEGEGTGLGLSMCASIIEKHKGEITAANNPDKGVTFTIKLPKEGV